MADPQLPRAQSPLVDRAGHPMPEWYDFLRELLALAAEQSASEESIAVLQAAVAALEAAEPELGQILGDMSVDVTGLLGQVVQLRLVGDTVNPGKTYYYGTNPDDAKGFHAVADTVEAAAGELTKTVDADGVSTFGLEDVTPGTTASFLLTAFDGKGRRSNEVAGTAADVPYDDTGNTYVLGANVQAALDATDTALAGKQPLAPSLTALSGALLPQAVNDAAAAIAGVPVGGFYANASAVLQRQT